MKSLYYKLTLEASEKLRQEAALYPITTKAIIDDLKNYNFWLDLPYGTIIRLHRAIYGLSDVSVTNIDELFNL